MLNAIVGIAVVVGLLGIVIPVLPGTILIALAILAWGVVTGTPAAWLITAICLVLLAGGMTLTWYLTTHRTRAAGVPGSSLVVAGIAGIIGFFVVPVVGLLLFFPLGLFVAEYVRIHRIGDPSPASRAWTSALVALKATGLGMIGELALALAAAGTWLGAVLNGV
ncbi:MAG: DUF456 domain-containing protein [Propionicimonas sp.]|uniref:DUF456 domain-containing protein n=1 Tax=Propionicimonas sp. TaxID=1955623 RepID=UPI003D109978